MPDDVPTAVEYCGVGFMREGVAQFAGGRPLDLIPATDVRSIVLRYGFRSAHPMVQITLGGLLAAAGTLDVFRILLWLLRGGTLSTVSIRLIWLLPFGLWLLVDGLRRGYWLDITTDKSGRKLAFDRRVEVSELATLLQAARETFGYHIDDTILPADRAGPSPGP